jgi:Ca-activated chloride channel family protein
MLRTAQGEVEAVRLGTDVDLAVSGPTVRARVTQAFRNTTAGWVEAVYVFPLPDDGAVDSLKLVVGDRIVVGNIKKREEAKAEYEAAREAGQTAGLVEQERANVFTSSVANIGPGETVLVQIEYQAPVRLEAGVYSLRTPLVVAPRYSPPPVAGADPVPDRARITPPVADPKGRAPNPVSLSVSLQPGFALGEVRSAYHPVVVTPDRNGAKVRLQQGLAPANRDFELTWRAASTAPAASLFRERVGGRDFLLAYVTPPAAGLAGPRLPREVVLVIDNSGSMAGESMPQAKASLDYALSRLRPRTASTWSVSTTPLKPSSPTPSRLTASTWPAPAPLWRAWRRRAGPRCCRPCVRL